MYVYMNVFVFMCIIYSLWGKVLWGQKPQVMRTALSQIPCSISNDIQDLGKSVPLVYKQVK